MYRILLLQYFYLGLCRFPFVIGMLARFISVADRYTPKLFGGSSAVRRLVRRACRVFLLIVITSRGTPREKLYWSGSGRVKFQGFFRRQGQNKKDRNKCYLSA